MFKTIILGFIGKKLKEPTTYAGLGLMIAGALHANFSPAQMADFQNLAVLIVGAVFVYFTEHKMPPADAIKAMVDDAAKLAKDSVGVLLAILIALPLLGACATAENNGAWISAQAKAGGAFCGKDYDISDIEMRKLCLGLVLTAAVEASSDRVTHGATADAAAVSGFIASLQGDLSKLASDDPEVFFNADEFNYERKLTAETLRVVKREVSFIQVATAGLAIGTAAATGGSMAVAIPVATSSWWIPDFIGKPATDAADFAGKIVAFQSDAAGIVSQVKSGKLQAADVWAEIQKRVAANKVAVDTLTKAQ